MDMRTPPPDFPKHDGFVLRRLEWIAVILFIVNLFMLIYTYSLYYNDESWGKAVVAIGTVTSVVLLISLLFSIFGSVTLSRIALAVGLVGLMILVVSFGAKLIQNISGSHILGLW